MRIVIVSFDEPFFLPMFFNAILKVHSDKVIGCIIHPYRKSFLNLIREILHMYSFLEQVKLILLYIYRRFLSLLSSHHPSSVASVMRCYGIPIHHVPSINSGKTKELIASLDPDIIIAQTSQYVTEHLLNLPRRGWINKHASLLPNYRGLHPIFWALYHNEPTIGVTIHRMTPILDHGPLLAQEKIPIRQRSIFKLYEDVFQVGANLINKVLLRTTTARKLPLLVTKVYKSPTARQIRELRSKGYRFI